MLGDTRANQRDIIFIFHEKKYELKFTNKPRRSSAEAVAEAELPWNGLWGSHGTTICKNKNKTFKSSAIVCVCDFYQRHDREIKFV